VNLGVNTEDTKGAEEGTATALPAGERTATALPAEGRNGNSNIRPGAAALLGKIRPGAAAVRKRKLSCSYPVRFLLI